MPKIRAADRPRPGEMVERLLSGHPYSEHIVRSLTGMDRLIVLRELLKRGHKLKQDQQTTDWYAVAIPRETEA